MVLITEMEELEDKEDTEEGRGDKKEMGDGGR